MRADVFEPVGLDGRGRGPADKTLRLSAISLLLKNKDSLAFNNQAVSVSSRAMEYRKLGKTGWNVSVIGYGAAPLGGVYGKLDEKEGIRSVHTAIDLGINFIDTAPYYGATA